MYYDDDSYLNQTQNSERKTSINIVCNNYESDIQSIVDRIRPIKLKSTLSLGKTFQNKKESVSQLERSKKCSQIDAASMKSKLLNSKQQRHSTDLDFRICLFINNEQDNEATSSNIDIYV